MRAPAPDLDVFLFRRRNFLSLLGPLLEQRQWAALVGIAALVQVVGHALGFFSLNCIFREFTGVACPGCGLTTGSLQFFRGDWMAALASHVFTPVFLGAASLLLVGSFLADELRERLAWRVTRLEQRSGCTLALLLLLVLDWAVKTF